MAKSKLKVSRKMQYLINVERLLSCIGMLDSKSSSMHLEWYPKKLHDSISKFMYNDIHDITKSLVEWIENNVNEKYFD